MRDFKRDHMEAGRTVQGELAQAQIKLVELRESEAALQVKVEQQRVRETELLETVARLTRLTCDMDVSDIHAMVFAPKRAQRRR